MNSFKKVAIIWASVFAFGGAYNLCKGFSQDFNKAAEESGRNKIEQNISLTAAEAKAIVEKEKADAYKRGGLLEIACALFLGADTALAARREKKNKQDNHKPSA